VNKPSETAEKLNSESDSIEIKLIECR